MFHENSKYFYLYLIFFSGKIALTRSVNFRAAGTGRTQEISVCRRSQRTIIQSFEGKRIEENHKLSILPSRIQISLRTFESFEKTYSRCRLRLGLCEKKNSQFSQVFCHERNCHIRKLSNFAKLQLLNDKIDLGAKYLLDFSPLVPSKREKNVLVCLVCIFLREMCLLFNF